MKVFLHASKEVWIFIALTLISSIVLFNFVNLTPRVDHNFFFSNNDPQFKDEASISHSFDRKDSLLIINAQGPIYAAGYMNNVRNLGDALASLEGVASIKSIAHGPRSLTDALRSPFWKRLLITKDRKSTNIIVFLKNPLPSTTIGTIEQLTVKASTHDFHLLISGPPYIIELVSRHLLKDIRVFSLLVLVIFGMVILFIFRSGRILLGTTISCISASMWTLMMAHLLGIKIGLLTANLATIVFVLTLSHIIFLTYNWKYVCSSPTQRPPVDEAIRLTFSPSFWSMITNALAFLSLLFVPAQPLKELGASGVVGAIIAMVVAYSIYPAFLRLVEVSSSTKNVLDQYQQKMGRFLEQRRKIMVIAIFALFLLALPGLWRANTDPSLISYFTKNSSLAKGLTYVDIHGGSSPLILVIKNADDQRLDTKSSYRRLWALQRTLEKYDEVGSCLSLPVLMAEAKRNVLASLLSWEKILTLLEQPQFESIASSFITPDRKEGLFLLRMNESHRKDSRIAVIEKIKQVVEAHGFVPSLVGGIYSLQGHLAQLITSSIIFGLGQLILVFALIGWIVARSFTITFAITLSICVIPVIILGIVGWLRIPLDIISAPASNIALGLGIDSMIHMVRAYRRTNDWQTVRHRFWQPVLTFTLVMALGFGIFVFSEFPSTQRFGATVVFGALIASVTALFVMPWASQWKSRKPR